jgi:hypothetical protein
MKKLTLFILITSFLLTACNQELITGRGKIVTSSINLSTFDKIEIVGSCDVELYNGEECYAELSDYENIIPYLEVKVEGNTLIIKTKDNISLIGSKAKVKVFTPHNIKDIAITGSGDVDINGIFNSLTKIMITGSGDVEASVTSNVSMINLTITGSGDIDVLKINANTANCSITGSGNIKVSALQYLNVNISGSGDVYYKGNPSVNTSISGSGNVIHIE